MAVEKILCLEYIYRQNNLYFIIISSILFF